MKKYILMFGWVVLSLVCGFGQSNFIQLNDATGEPATQVQITKLNAASNELISTVDYELPNPGQFKVFDVGFYLHERDYNDGIPEAFQRAIGQSSAQSSYFILFGRQINDEDESINLWIDFEFPEENFLCINSEQIEFALNQKYENLTEKGIDDVFIIEEKLIKSLEEILFGGFCCSAYRESLNKGGKIVQNTCIDFEKVEIATDYLIDNEEFIGVLDKVYEIFKLYQNCDGIYRLPKPVLDKTGHGLISYCFWKDSSLPPYSIADVAFGSGLVDGFYNYFVKIGELLYIIANKGPKALSGLMDLLGKYIQYKTFCEIKEHNSLLSYLNPLEAYKTLAERMNEKPWTKPIVKAQFDLIMQDPEFTNWLFSAFDIPDEEECTKLQVDATKIENTVDLIFNILTDWDTFVENFSKLTNFVAQHIIVILERTSDFDNDSRYYQGFYSSQALIDILGGYTIKSLSITEFMAQVGSKADILKNSIKSGFNKNFRKLYVQRLKSKPPYKTWTLNKQKRFDKDFNDNTVFADWILGNESKIALWDEFDGFFVSQNGSYWSKFKNQPIDLPLVRTRALRAMREYPKGYVDAVNQFGITRGDLFIKHGVDYGDEFFVFINNFKANSSLGLTDSQIHAIFGYTTNFFYSDLNLWLRLGINQNQTQSISNLISTGLNKLPSWSGGNLGYRGIKIRPGQDLMPIVNRYEVGSVVPHPEFVSVSATPLNPFYTNPQTKVRIIIELKPKSDIKDISALSDGVLYSRNGFLPPELSFGPNKNFLVIDKNKVNDIYYITLKEQ